MGVKLLKTSICKNEQYPKISIHLLFFHIIKTCCAYELIRTREVWTFILWFTRECIHCLALIAGCLQIQVLGIVFVPVCTYTPYTASYKKTPKTKKPPENLKVLFGVLNHFVLCRKMPEIP